MIWKGGALHWFHPVDQTHPAKLARQVDLSQGQTVRLSPTLMQPTAADEVASPLTQVALAEPLDGTVEIAGPEPIRMDEIARRFLRAT
jgi:uncharacterized protein YbjT (DUF2867 family)